MAHTKLIIKKSNVAGKIPLASQLEYGELALNVADKALYSKDSHGHVFQIGDDQEHINGGNWNRVVVYDGDDADPTTVSSSIDGGGSL